MKYIINIEKIPHTDLYKAVKARTLVFDDYGMNHILEPLEPEITKAYNAGYAKGVEAGRAEAKEREEKEREIDWTKVPKDTKVYVWGVWGNERNLRYFDEFKNGKYHTYADGATSWNALDTIAWEHCELAEPAKEEWYK